MCAVIQSLQAHCDADGKGAYACINPIGGKINVELLKAMRDGGTLLLFALLGCNQFEVGCMSMPAMSTDTQLASADDMS